MKSLTELLELPDYPSRLMYLKLDGSVADRTFGGLRELNQRFYKSREWLDIRNYVIARDLGRDLALPGHEIFGPIYVHHINPVTLEDLHNDPSRVLDPNGLITVSRSTHERIHYGVEFNNPTGLPFVERSPNDTTLW